MDVIGGGGLPAGGGDFDEVTLGIGEVEEDAVRGGAVAATGDAEGDADVEAGGVGGGLGFEVRTEGAEGVGGGDGLVEGVALGEEPIAEGGGADGEEAGAVEGGGGDLDEGEAVGGGEGEGVFEDMVEGGEAGGAGEPKKGGAWRLCYSRRGGGNREAGGGSD